MQEGFDRLVDRYTLKTWPSVAEIVQACSEIKRHRERISEPIEPEKQFVRTDPRTSAAFLAVFEKLKQQQTDGRDFEYSGVTYTKQHGDMLYPIAKAMHDNYAGR